jgi:hypothetical protein
MIFGKDNSTSSHPLAGQRAIRRMPWPLARAVSTEETRANLVAMAEVWQRLADQQSEGTDLAEVSAPPAAEASQPVIQQQQQVQPKDGDKE